VVVGLEKTHAGSMFDETHSNADLRSMQQE
jgi:hypothetical protein